ncbi:MAG: uroporphyrinogen decarboxylase family protein [Chloroflexota bacterium]
MTGDPSALSHRERVRIALNHQEPDRVPLDLGSMHTSIETYAYGPLKQYLGIALSRPVRTFTRDHVEPDPELLELFDIDTRYLRAGPPDAWTMKLEADNSFVDEFGARWQKPPGSLYFDPVGYPLENATLADLDSYPWPDPHDPGRTRGLREKAKHLYETTDYALCLDTVGLGIFESCWALRGIQNFLCDLVAEPELAYALMGKMTDFKVALYADLMEAVGKCIDVVFVSDDLGTQRAPMMSLPVYRELIKPHQARLWGSIKAGTRAKLFMHSCGSVRAFIPDFVELGLDILNPVQPLAAGMNTAELKQEFGDRLSFWGAIDEQGTLSTGTPEQVREEVRRRIRDLAPGGGYILGPSHNIQGDVTPQNVATMYETARIIGRYPIQV